MFPGADYSPLLPTSQGPAGRKGWGWRVWGALAVVVLWVSGGVAAPLLSPLPQASDEPGTQPNAVAPLAPSAPQASPLPAMPAVPPLPAMPAIPTVPGGVPSVVPTVLASPPVYRLPQIVASPEGGGVEPAGFQPPEVPPKAPSALPAPNPYQPGQLVPGQLFPEDRPRLSRMPGPGPLGTTPVPTKEELEALRGFVEGVIDPRYTLDLIQGRSRLVLLKVTPTRTQIAEPDVATFRLLEPNGRQMLIIGSKPGITVLTLWFPDPDNPNQEKVFSYLVRVLPDPEAKERLEAIYQALEIEINKAFPNSRVRLALVGDKLMISGQAHDIYDATQILRIARSNAPAAGGTASRPPIASITPTGQSGDPLRPDSTPGLESYQVSGGSVINNLRVPGEQQVMLRVVVAEVNRAAARSIGVNFGFTNNTGTQTFAQLTGSLGLPGGNLPVNLDNGQIPVAINALRTLNYARSLAEPNLTALNGQSATFLAGGQFPVPVVGGFGAGAGGLGGLQGVQFVPFGVQLAFVPYITDRDRIRLVLNATVSTRDNAGGTSVAGSNVPGLNVRTFSTTVELREGQTMAVAGLIQNNLGATANRVPFFGDLPYIGRLASFQQASHGEQELVVLVTPELVHPLEPREIPPLPGSDLFEPGDLEFYLAGRLESRRSYDYRSSVMTDIHRMLRYRRCEQVYIIGPSGHVEPPPPPAVGTK